MHTAHYMHTLHAYPITSNTLKSHYLPINIVSLYFNMPSFPCGQSGHSRIFYQTSDCTNHIQHHHLSFLNIWLNTHVLYQPPSPPSPCQQSKPSSPPPHMPELVDDDDDEEEDFDMNSPNHTSSPFPDIPVSPSSNIPPSSPQQKCFSNSAPKVPPKITHIFHPIINSMLLLLNF